jgi:hypothetical protein
MNKTIKLASAMILFIFLLFITEEVEVAIIPLPSISSTQFTKTSIKCKSSYDCSDFVMAPNTIISLCREGYCLEFTG